MAVFDIIILSALGIALYKGYKRGLVLEVMGLASIVIAGYAAYYLTQGVAEMLKWDFAYATQLTFVLVFIAFMLGVVTVARLLTKLLSTVGLGALNQIGGAVVSVFKYLLILSILFSLFNALNSHVEIMSKEQINSSVTYKPMESVTNTLFPYFDKVKKSVNDLKKEYLD